MSLLFLAVVVVLTCLAVVLIRTLTIDPPYKVGLTVVVLTAAILAILWKLGAFKPGA
jgi:hypothetical protein